MALDNTVTVSRFVYESNATLSAYEANVGIDSCMPYFSVGGSEVFSYAFATMCGKRRAFQCLKRPLRLPTPPSSPQLLERDHNAA